MTTNRETPRAAIGQERTAADVTSTNNKVASDDVFLGPCRLALHPDASPLSTTRHKYKTQNRYPREASFQLLSSAICAEQAW